MSAPRATRTIGYVRVSSRQQAEQGLSLAAQRAKLEAYARLYGLDLVEIVVDRLSAKTLKRPALQQALDRLRDGSAEALLIAKLDRLTRSVRDLGQLLEEGFASGRWTLLSVGEQIDGRSAAGRLVLNVLTSVAQWEREAIGERTAAVIHHKIALNEYVGGQPPFGYRLAKDARHLRRHRAEQRVLAEVRSLRARKLSLRQIAARLADRGWRSRSSRPFDAGQIARMLRHVGSSSSRRSSTKRHMATAA